MIGVYNSVVNIKRRIVEFINYLARVTADGGTVVTGADGTTKYMSDQIKKIKNIT